MAGRRVRGANLLWTTIDVHQSSYIGQPFIYSFEKVGSGCGLLGPNSVVALDTMAFWMSRSGFWIYDGYVKPLPCDVGDFVFSDINMNQASKVFGFHNSEFGEVWWLYPSSASNEIDSYISYNYRENHWNVGSLARTCAVPAGVFSTPLMMSADGYVYEHETGSNYDGQQQFAESGPYQLGSGDTVVSITGMVPDESTLGETSVTFKTKFYPTGDESTYGPLPQTTPPTCASRLVRSRCAWTSTRPRIGGLAPCAWMASRVAAGDTKRLMVVRVDISANYISTNP